jgi:hypothetical protein
MPRFDDVFTQVHAGDGVNVFEFDSRTAPSKPPSMTWAESVNMIGEIVTESTKECMLDDEAKAKIHEAWATILRGV